MVQLVPLLREVLRVDRSQHGVHSVQPAPRRQNIAEGSLERFYVFAFSLRGLPERSYHGLCTPVWYACLRGHPVGGYSNPRVTQWGVLKP
jgi:hypothetical protein